MGAKRTLKQIINQLDGLSGLRGVFGKPQKLNLTTSADGVTTLYWLEGGQQEVHLAVLGGPDEPTAMRRVFEQGSNSAPEAPLSKEEELLRERLRSRLTGITSYHVRHDDGAVFFTSGISHFFFHPKSGKIQNIFECVTDTSQQALLSNKPNLCLSIVSTTVEGGLGRTTLSFVNNHNVFLAHATDETDGDGQTKLVVVIEQITTIGTESHSCGTADYIIQEEFTRYTGHYVKGRYVLYSYTDTSMLNEVTLIGSKGNKETIPYPRVGDPNATTVLSVYDTQSKVRRVVPPAAISAVAPWAEYTPRFGFKDADTIYFSVLSRDQERYAVLSCSITALPTIDEAGLETLSRDASQGALLGMSSSSIVIEWEQHIPWAWVEVLAGKPIHFGSKYDLIACHDAESDTSHFHIFIRPHGGDKSSWKALTQGEWNVCSGAITVSSGYVFFNANASDRLENSLYALPLPESIEALTAPYTASDLLRITPPGEHVHSFTVKRGVVCAVVTTATTFAVIRVIPLRNGHPAESTVVEESAGAQRVVSAQELKTPWYSMMSMLPVGVPNGVTVPQIINVKNARGVQLSGALFVSPVARAEPAGVPLAMYVYGGPHAQLVYKDNLDVACNPLLQMMLLSGISVLVADNQMSNANGLRDLSICKNNMGCFETDDYVAIIRAVTHQGKGDTPKVALPSGFKVDPARVAIFGWSYGGYATLLAMAQARHVFKLGFSGAPVSDWRLYDTAYTERYMGVLYADGTSRTKAGVELTTADGKVKQHSTAYVEGCVNRYVDGFPDDLNRVFIAHGLLDENVHFSNSCDVADAMVVAGKPVVMMVYPGERHALQNRPASRMHYNAQMIKTMEELL